MAMKWKLKKGDEVVVMTGKDKGKSGKITRLDPEKGAVLVEGVNRVKRHTKPTQLNPQGGIIEKSLPLAICKVMLKDPKTGKPTRVGRKWVEEKGEKKLVRFAKKSGQVLS